MVIVGIFLVIVTSFIVNYLIHLETLRQKYNLPIPYEFFLMSVVFLITFFIYSFVQRRKIKAVLEDIHNLTDEIDKFETKKEFHLEAKSREFFSSFVALNKVFNSIIETLQKDEKKLITLENDKNKIETILDLENIGVAIMTESGKVIKANKLFLKLLDSKSETKLNMKIKHIMDVFEEELDKDFSKLIDKDLKVTINNTKFMLHIEKVPQDMSYVLTLTDITTFEEEKKEIIKKTEYASDNLKTLFTINKTEETLMIKVLNYDNYASHLGVGIMEVFEERFVKRIQSLGYKDVFKVENSIFAVYDFHVNFDEYKKTLEENIIVTVGKDRYIFTPKVVLASGVNFEQSYQQILESSKTLISKEKTNPTYNLELVKLINTQILSNNIKLGYKSILNQNNTILIYPIIMDEYGSVIPQNEVESIAREFNLYLFMLKQVIVNHINIIKNYKIIINVSSEDLFSMTMLSDLLSFIKREELMLIFNISINSKYSMVHPILKQIKSYAQLGIRNVGHGYISFKDIYALKVAYLEIDDSVIELIKEDSNWEFLLDSIKLLISDQHTHLLSNNYMDEKVYQISKDLKVYKN